MTRRNKRESVSKKTRTSRTTRSNNLLNEKKKVDNTPLPYPLHDSFSEYTNEELLQIKKDVCLAHQCPYASRINWSTKSGATYTVTCNYILITQKRRNCMPDVCQYWKDEVVNRKADNRHLFK